ncbi:hypothetical protein FB45DRAFT_1049917 [Roridomyces roridus]|uniref:F-box domain-containing protein n=1 Tax=Roridomyces roridus TaxID=1738132 RepID=A0AAD7CI41_9AGAR|nr:hypothetical protein FB45DRAFT_1049917 [Roridomyces roridus]
MDSRPSCDALCSLHCVSTASLSSPFPELYSNGVPSDSQHAIISHSIQRAKEDLARVEAEIATLKAQRAELDKFIRDHTGMLSAMRRFPNEIFGEIFSRCVDPDAAFDPLRNDVWILARVCQRWRAVALDIPKLWRHFVLRGICCPRLLKPFLKVQLDRARSTPLSIRLLSRPPLDGMDVFLDVPAQWEEVQFRDAHLLRFLSGQSHFSRLTRLEITSYSPLLEGQTGIINMVDSLPALEHLQLNLGFKLFPRQLLLPWSQLGTCILSGLRALDILWILSLVSKDTHVSITDLGHGLELVTRRSPIRSVQIARSNSLHTHALLRAMTLPNLEKLEISWDEGPDISQAVISLLDRSACRLRHLRLPRASCFELLFSTLNSPHARDIVQLDIPHVPGLTHISSLLAMLSENGELVPHLRTLAIRADSRNIEALNWNVLKLLADRKPTMRRLSFKLWGWDFQERERDSMDTGLEVVVLEG